MPKTLNAEKKASSQDTPRLTRSVKGPVRTWDFRSSSAPTERKATYIQFQKYLELGEGRSLQKIADLFEISICSVSRCAKNNHWKERAADYDRELPLLRLEQERLARFQEHSEKLESFRTRSETLGTALITASARLLQTANATLAAMQENGEQLDRRLLSGALNASAKVAEAGRTLMAQSLGVDALLTGIQGAEEDDALGG
jgi:predicted DNA-binding protein YlxM (UPF0122 family)